RARPQRRRKIVEKGIGLGYFVIHVHEDRGVKRCAGQSRIMRLTESELNVRQFEALGPPRELDEVVLDDVLRDHLARGTEETGQPDSVIAAAGTNVANCHARFETKELGDLARFIQCVALLLGRAARTYDVCHETLQLRKSPGWFPRWCQIGDLLL